MSYPVYYVPAGDVLPYLFDTFDGGTGASITMTGLAVTDIEIYKDGGVTQRASDAGYTLLDTDGIDFDGVTGVHGFSVDTGDNTDAGFYTVGSWFHVVVSSITVDGQTVNFIAYAFRLMAAEGVAGVPDVNTTHISDTAQTGNDVGGDVNLILEDTADMQPKLGTPAGASMSADIAAVKTETAAILDDTDLIDDATSGLAKIATDVAATLADTAEIGAAGAGLTEAGGTGDHLTGVPWNAAWDAEVQSEATDALNAYDPPTNAEMEARTLASGALAQLSQNLANCITGTASGTPTTTTMVSDISVAVDDQFNGRIITFDDDTTTAALRRQSTDITGCTAASNTLTFTALTTAPVSGDTFTIT